MGKIAVINTTAMTISGLKPHFERELSNHKILNFLDESLLPEINEAGQITESIRNRFFSLINNAALSKPDVILCACSSVGGLLEESRKFLEIPALRIDEPMIREALTLGNRIAVMATLPSTLLPTTDFLRRCAAESGKEIQIEEIVVEGAGALMSSGKTEEYKALVAEKIREAQETSQVILLAQASMAGALQVLGEPKRPVLTSPQSGIAALKAYLKNEES